MLSFVLQWTESRFKANFNHPKQGPSKKINISSSVCYIEKIHTALHRQQTAISYGEYILSTVEPPYPYACIEALSSLQQPWFGSQPGALCFVSLPLSLVLLPVVSSAILSIKPKKRYNETRDISGTILINMLTHEHSDLTVSSFQEWMNNYVKVIMVFLKKRALIKSKMATMAVMFVMAPYLNIDCSSVLSLMLYGKVNNWPQISR